MIVIIKIFSLTVFWLGLKIIIVVVIITISLIIVLLLLFYM